MELVREPVVSEFEELDFLEQMRLETELKIENVPAKRSVQFTPRGDTAILLPAEALRVRCHLI